MGLGPCPRTRVRPRALRGRYPAALALASRGEAARAQAVLVDGGEALALHRVERDVRAPAGAGVDAAPERLPAHGALDRPHVATVPAAGARAADDQRMRLLLPVLVAALALPAASAGAATFVPPRGKVYTGLSGSTSASPFTQQVGSDVAVFGVFTKWYGQNEYAFRAAHEAGARLMLHVSTQDGYGTRELITPRGIARGEGDRYLLSLNRRIAEAGEPVYVRLLAEMNQANNGYSAFDRNGRSRGPAHSTRAFRAAWRRSALILRGGPRRQRSTRSCAPCACRRSRETARTCHVRRSRCCGSRRPRARPRSPPTPRAPTGPAGATSTGSEPTSTRAFPQLRQARTLLRRLPRQALRVRRVGAVGARRPGLRAALLLLDGTPTGACGCTSTTRER